MIQGPPSDAIIGRDRELAVLRAALVDALGGQGRLALISGEPGIGKSTLAAALADEAAKAGVTVAMARAPETSGAPPYWLWTQALRAEADANQIPERGLLASRQPILARVLPELAAPQGEASTPASSDADAERFRLVEEIASLLLRGGPDLPRVLVLDDLHAADASSLDVLAHLTSRLGSGPLFIIATYRDAPAELTPALQTLLARASRQPGTIRIPLSGFDVATVRSQLTGIIGRDVDTQLADQVHTRTDGNPFFVAEIGRLLAEAPGEHDLRTSATVPPRVREAGASQTAATNQRMQRRTHQHQYGRRSPASSGVSASGAIFASC